MVFLRNETTNWFGFRWFYHPDSLNYKSNFDSSYTESEVFEFPVLAGTYRKFDNAGIVLYLATENI